MPLPSVSVGACTTPPPSQVSNPVSPTPATPRVSTPPARAVQCSSPADAFDPKPVTPQGTTLATAKALAAQLTTGAKSSAVLAELQKCSDVNGLVTELNRQGLLLPLLYKDPSPQYTGPLLRELGRTSGEARCIVEPFAMRLGRGAWLQFSLGQFALGDSGAKVEPSAWSLVSKYPNEPFTGSGATGKPGAVAPDDVVRAFAQKALEGKTDLPLPPKPYGNPLKSLRYIDALSPEERVDQVKLLTALPISSVEPASYGAKLPARADVIRAAAAAYNLEPELVAAFILAEQRDQSANEDMFETTKATLGMPASIGLGQVKTDTVTRYGLFDDLVAPGDRPAGDTDPSAIELLASDEYNIFAVAKYMRTVANAAPAYWEDRTALMSEGALDWNASNPDAGATDTALMLGETSALAFQQHSSSWPPGNIVLLASEYTSTPWDGNLEAYWGKFVLEAYVDVKQSGVFSD